jgi:hypothetical protein
MVMGGDGQISVSLAMCMVLGGEWRFFEDKNMNKNVLLPRVGTLNHDGSEKSRTC